MGGFGLKLVAPRRDLVMGYCECGNELSGVYLTGNLFNSRTSINPLNAELNPICHLLALGAHHILHVGRIRVN